jgi:hypothetical protein
VDDLLDWRQYNRQIEEADSVYGDDRAMNRHQFLIHSTAAALGTTALQTSFGQMDQPSSRPANINRRWRRRT